MLHDDYYYLTRIDNKGDLPTIFEFVPYKIIKRHQSFVMITTSLIIGESLGTVRINNEMAEEIMNSWTEKKMKQNEYR